MSSFDFTQVTNAVKRINPYIHETPVMESKIINSMCGRNVYFKSEHLQKTGSFKIRGALNNILSKMEQQPVKGVITYSSGNHGQAVAYAAKILNIPSIIVAHESTKANKCDAMRQYGANIRFCGQNWTTMVQTCDNLAKEFGYIMVHPFDDYETIIGQGTIGIEFFNQVPSLDAVLTSVGGGGLTAGCSIALKHLNPNIKMYCIEPEGKDLERSLRAGSRLWDPEPKCVNTIAEGVILQQPGKLTFPILCDLVERQVLTVNDSDMIEGMKLSMKYLKQVIEAAAGASMQALFKYNDDIPPQCKNIGIVLCGGNLDIDSIFKF